MRHWPSTLLLLLALPLCAQHHGNRNPAGQTPTGPPSDNSDLQDFARAVALQATPEQAAAFKDLTATIETAANAHESLQSGTSAVGARDLSDAADEAQMDSERFLSGLTDSQKNGMKSLVKKIHRADLDLGKDAKSLDKTNTIPPSVVERIGKSLQDLRENHLAMGKEMGIPETSASH